ncbi:MAG: DUF2283 domain-containing protein [Methanobrevibacter sp.]|nr:DUF2283 domain-containing protein [Methanobrevibacter sp.]
MKKNILKYDYDEKNDSLFIYSTDKYEYEFSLNSSRDVLVDIDKKGVPVAFEFLNASKTFEIKKQDFSNLNKIFINSSIRENLIKIHIQLVFTLLDNPINVGIDRIIDNVSNLPNNDYELALI